MKLFVAKLNRDAVESDLLEWFGSMGPVRSAKIVMDRDTGQSKCFGFVEMESREGGEQAISEMNGKEFMGFRMVVKEAEERGSRPRPSGGPAHDGGGRGSTGSQWREAFGRRTSTRWFARRRKLWGGQEAEQQKEKSATSEAGQIFGWTTSDQDEEDPWWWRLKRLGRLR